MDPSEREWLDHMARLDDEERAEDTAAWLEATGLDAPSTFASRQRATTLDPLLPRMQAEQLKRVQRRYAPDAKATRKADMIAEVGRTLGSPSRLAAVVAGLPPLERALLGELKRRGGAADGYELVTFAVLRGHHPPPPPNALAYGLPFARSAAASFLAGPILEGLLLVSTFSSAWFGYGYGGGSEDVVSADPRLLAAVPDERPEPPIRLQVEAAAEPGAPAHHPAASVLELLDALQLVAGEGGVVVTRRGTVAKPFLARLVRKRPALADRLETHLLILGALGLIRRPEVDDARQPWQVDADAAAQLRHLPLPMMYAAIVDAGRAVGDPVVHELWDRAPFGGSREAFWRAALEALAALPEHPMPLADAVTALWDQVLSRVFGPGPTPASTPGSYTTVLFGTRGQPSAYVGPRAAASFGAERAHEAVRLLLTGPFAQVGLVSVASDGAARSGPGFGAEIEPGAPGATALFDASTGASSAAETDPASSTPSAVTLTLGARWYARARALVHHHQTYADAGQEPAWAVPDGEPAEGRRHPALLVQPNFDVLAYLDLLDSASVATLECAELERIDAHTAGFHLSRESVHRALESGSTVEQVLERLERHAPTVPDNVRTALEDWAAQRQRLRVSVDVRVLEFASPAERDAALADMRGARPVGGRFAVLAPDTPAPAVTREHAYDGPPERVLAFSPSGTVRVHGALDLAARAALRRVARPGKRGSYALDAEAIRAGALTPALREVLEARAREGLPAPLDALLRAWRGEAPAPAVATAVLFRHPDAAAWAAHPRVAPHLATQLSPSTYLVKEGSGEALTAELAALGVDVGSELHTPGAELAVQGEGELLEGLSTRKMRELIEDAIRAGHALELRYTSERERTDRYGYPRRSRGAVRRERVRPEEVVYQGSLPYLLATTLGRGRERVIRIGYIEGLAVRAGTG